MLRDNLMSIAYFNSKIEFKVARIASMCDQANTPGADKKYDAQYLFQIVVNSYELMIARYSRGDSVETLKAQMSDIVVRWERAYQEELMVFSPAEMAVRTQFRQNLDIYVVSLWLVSLALCLDADDALFVRLLRLCGNEGEDWLFERLAAVRVLGRKPAATLCYPKTYAMLKYAIEASDKVERERLMKAFLVRWYASLSKTYWYDCHKGPEGGGYFGYWCFEAAGAVKACRIDDAAFRDLPHYPADLIAR